MALALLLVTGMVFSRQAMQNAWPTTPATMAVVNAEVPATLAITTIALGPLRSLMVNVLMWRAVRLQDEGNYFEAIQLAEWISMLQPKQVPVWRFQGWNMAFNLSVAVNSAEESWNWVLQGIRLLRDKGLSFNPRNKDIQRELCSIFLNKMSSDRDPHHLYYKRQWAKLMSQYLPHGTREDMEALQAAPATEAALMALPGMREMMARAEQLKLAPLTATSPEPGEFWTPEQRKTVLDALPPDSLTALKRYLARHLLATAEHMNLANMMIVDDEYGPFDWRLPQAYAVYFGAKENYADFAVNDDLEYPLIRQAMEDSFRQGRLIFMDSTNFVVSNNLEIAGKIHDYLEALIEREKNPAAEARFRAFHEFCSVILYNYGYIAQAREFYAEFREEFDDQKNMPETLEEYVMEHSPAILGLGSKADQRTLVGTSLFQAYLSLGLGNDHRALGYISLAYNLWQRNQVKYADRPDLRWPPFQQLQAAALNDAIARSPGALKDRLTGLLRDDGSVGEFTPTSELPPLNIGETHSGSSKVGEQAAGLPGIPGVKQPGAGPVELPKP